jgi:hypothetical protein
MKPTRLGARTNAALLVAVTAAFATGWLAFSYATAPARWSLVVHATAGVAILVLLPWKTLIARRGWRRPRSMRWASAALGCLILLSLAAGLGHSTGAVEWWGPFTAMEVHVGAALGAVPLAVWHIVARPIRVKPTDLSRRAVLRGAFGIAAAAGAYSLTEVGVRAFALPGASRRFTGSYEAGSFEPASMPVSSWMFDSVPAIDAGGWALRLPGGAMTYEQLADENDRVTATLDCTGGFYSTQAWAGVRLDRLLGKQPGRSIRVVSATGYDRRFPIEEAPRLLLATRFGDQALDAGHGFPARLVAPDRRGFWWVKWVVRIEVDDEPYWLQSPFPLQ